VRCSKNRIVPTSFAFATPKHDHRGMAVCVAADRRRALAGDPDRDRLFRTRSLKIANNLR
jgi:hypothetical protein